MRKIALLCLLIFSPPLFWGETWAQEQERGAVAPDELRLFTIPSFSFRNLEATQALPSYSSLKKAETRESFSAIQAPRRKPTKSERNVYIASEAYKWGTYAFDMRTTVQFMDRGAREVNPLYRLGGDRNPAAVVGISFGLNLAGSFANYYMVYKKGHPRIAAMINFFVGSVQLGLGFRNRSICQPKCGMH